MADSTPQLYIRLGSHAEKQYVLRTAHLFDGVIVGANLLESTPGATVSFAIRILGAGLKKAFAIDPMTYTFGMNLRYIESETIDRSSKPAGKKIGLKKSFAALALAYGEPVSSAVLKKKRPVNPTDFTAAAANGFAQTILEYQINRMKLHCESDPQLKDIVSELPDPSFVFAPYFYTDFAAHGSGWRKWHDLNVLLATSFAGIRAKASKHAVLCIDADVLTAPRELDEIASGYIGSGCSACWLWFSNLTEQNIGVPQLKNLVGLVHKFRDANILLFNMHGGFLSALLHKHGLTGFSHGVGYGESKDVVPVIGVTVPTVNYHLPPIHIRVPMLELERALPKLEITDADEFHRRVCDCTVCKGVLKGDLANVHEFGETIRKAGNVRESQTPDSAKKCRFHFLLARKKELEKVSTSSLLDIKQQLQQAYAEYSSLPTYLGLRDKAGHLAIWHAGV